MATSEGIEIDLGEGHGPNAQRLPLPRLILLGGPDDHNGPGEAGFEQAGNLIEACSGIQLGLPGLRREGQSLGRGRGRGAVGGFGGPVCLDSYRQTIPQLILSEQLDRRARRRNLQLALRGIVGRGPDGARLVVARDFKEALVVVSDVVGEGGGLAAPDAALDFGSIPIAEEEILDRVAVAEDLGFEGARCEDRARDMSDWGARRRALKF